MLTPEFIKEMQARLEQDKQRLRQELAPLTPHTELGDDDDENASELAVDEVNQDLIVRIKSDLAKIDTALAKIADGSYGVDDEGNEIGEQRLRALPWADKAI